MGAPHPRTVWVSPDLTTLQWRKVGSRPTPMGKDAMRVDDKTIYKAKGLSLKNELDLIAKLFDELENWEAPRWR